MYEKFSEKDEIIKVLSPDLPVFGGGPLLFCDKAAKRNYFYTKHRHQMILGETGTGKTTCYILNLVFNLLKKGENIVALDPKGDIFKKTAGKAQKEGYKIITFDFYNIAKSRKINLLTYVIELLEKGLDEKAAEHIAELAEILVTEGSQSDSYWITAAKNLFIGLIHSLMEVCEEKEKINIASVFKMLAEGMEQKDLNSYMKHFFKLLDENSPAKFLLHSYIFTANDTSGGIRSTLEDNLGFLVRSKSLIRALCQNDFRLSELEDTAKYAIYIILPDLGKSYLKLSGSIISQLMNFYCRSSYENGAPLKNRVNFIIEELGSSVGKAIPNLPTYLSDMRSRNVRCFFVLQALSQLEQHYNEAGAKTIKSNCDIIAFRTGDLSTLKELSERCGTRTVLFGSGAKTIPLIFPEVLGKLETGKALILLEDGITKYISELPYYEDVQSVVPHIPEKTAFFEEADPQIFSIKDFVDKKAEEAFEKEIEKIKEETSGAGFDFGFPGSSIRNFNTPPGHIPKNGRTKLSATELDEMFEEIDRKLKILDAKENARKYVFTIVKPGNIPEAAKALAMTEGERTFDEMRKKLEDCPVSFIIRKDELDAVYDALTDCGGLCTYSSVDEDEEDETEYEN